MQEEAVKEAQRQFFARNRSGCAFAAYAAKRPKKYGWLSVITEVDAGNISETLGAAINDPDVQALSMIFPNVETVSGLIDLINACLDTGSFIDEGDDESGMRFVRLRAQVGGDRSWVSGFGPFEFLPKTRQAPHCELAIRVKPRPAYNWSFKETPAGIIHLADLDMKGLSDRNLWKLWGASFETTKNILGHTPDDESAAKTTFVIPL